MNKDVIIACDFDNDDKLFEFLNSFKDLKNKPYLKIGMEMFYGNGPSLIRKLKDEGYKIFLDLKLHDIPTTVNKAMKQIALLNVDMVNVHAAGGIDMMKAAKDALINTSTKLIAVTMLTSTSKGVMNEELNIPGNIDDCVLKYAKNTKKAGLDGVVCSALEATLIKSVGLESITPGIRFNSDNNQDQVRVVTPSKAKELGSTYIVVGRTITKSDNVLESYEKCLKDFI